jgi:hypothetical protein
VSDIIKGRGFWMLALVLAVAMSVTRVGHFGEFQGPPDASWAVFFLAGMWLREPRLFPAFFALAWVADLTAFAMGTPTDCYSPAYFFLIPAYGALWAAGHWIGSHESRVRVPTILALGSVAAFVTFAIANLGMYLLVPSPSATTLGAYAAAVAGYFPGYLLTMGIYVGAALVAAAVLRFKRLASE